jgi:pyruvate,water dikinase
MGARGKRAEEKLNDTMGRLAERWDTEWLPEIKNFLAYCDAFDLTGADTPDLLAHLDAMLERSNRIWCIHFQIVTPIYVAMGLFDDLYRDLFGNEGAFDAYRLLEGFDNKTLETNRSLWDLSRKALATPEVCRVLEERAGSEVVAALEGSPAGQAFLEELNAFLDAYGHRGPTWGMSLPGWIEDPTPVINNLKDYVTQSEGDPGAELEALAAEREQALAEARERLKGYPQQVTNQFEFLLKAAQEGIVLTEDHGFWIDFIGLYRIRKVFMEVGRRLAGAGVIETPDDIFQLKLDELRASSVASPPDDRRSLIAERRAELEHFSAVTPPPKLGTDYGPPPDTPVTRAFGKFWGAPPQPQEDPGVWKGNAGSPGKARGPAKVIRSLAEADKLQRGDILVAETTSPPWTPLFATAAAIVTDTGGILSHCAVVAREYRIPAVVGTGTATSTISDGQTLEVDGDTGAVRIVE